MHDCHYTNSVLIGLAVFRDVYTVLLTSLHMQESSKISVILHSPSQGYTKLMSAFHLEIWNTCRKFHQLCKYGGYVECQKWQELSSIASTFSLALDTSILTCRCAMHD